MAKKAASKKALTKKAASKKALAKKAASKKALAKKAASKKAASKKAAGKKALAKKAASKKAPAKKAASKKSTPKKAAVKRAPASKKATKKATTKSAASKLARGAKKTGTKGTLRKAASARAASEHGSPSLNVRASKVELAPRSSASAAPSIPIPVKEVPRKPTILERARSIDARLSRQSVEFRDAYTENFDMSWIFHDTALEGTVYTYDELTTAFRSDEVTVVDSSVMPIYDAIRRQKEALGFVRDMVDKKRTPINVELLRRIYMLLHPEDSDPKAVKYRREVPQHRLYFHEYAPPDKIAYRVRQVIEWIANPETKRNVGVLKMAAKAHYDLVRAYPFAHDSGKVARLIMNLLLMRAGLPPAIIHATERQRYYEALKSPKPTAIITMLTDAVDNSLSSIEKMLDEHETRKRGFIS